jgi:hypothetical protein
VAYVPSGFSVRSDDVDWIHLVQDTDQWRALVNMVVDLWVP